MLLLNTRPIERAQALTQILEHDQIDVIELPLLELKAMPYSAELATLYQQLLHAQEIGRAHV